MGLNKELLNTPIIEGQLKRWLSLDYSIKKIKRKLEDIHLIIITEEELLEHIVYINNKLNKNKTFNKQKRNI